MEVGQLLAMPQYDYGLWLYRVVRTTPARLYVEEVERPNTSMSGPATGAYGTDPKPYVNRDGKHIPIRDMDHFATAQKAESEYRQSMRDIKSTAKSKSIAAYDRYVAACA